MLVLSKTELVNGLEICVPSQDQANFLDAPQSEAPSVGD
jgi:hypothetical protein